MRFGAVAGVSAQPDFFADLNVLSHPNPCAPTLEVAERDYTAVAPDHDVIAGECTPALADTPGLCQGVSDRRDTAVREMITLSVMRSHDSSCDRREHRAAEADKALRGSGRRREPKVKGADLPEPSTGTKSIAYEVAKSVVPWLGTRSAGLF